ncbi:MAG: hypothetical protein GX611_07825 [Clostridiales bacterium]|jgi:predicted membrane protein|nr:hypothetical protein [Clostridiales bacterium]
MIFLRISYLLSFSVKIITLFVLFFNVFSHLFTFFDMKFSSIITLFAGNIYNTRFYQAFCHNKQTAKTRSMCCGQRVIFSTGTESAMVPMKGWIASKARRDFFVLQGKRPKGVVAAYAEGDGRRQGGKRTLAAMQSSAESVPH